MPRRVWLWVHRVAGLTLAFFLVVAGLTGSVLSFAPEIHGALNPPVRVAVRNAPPLDGLSLRERALARVAPKGDIDTALLMVWRDRPHELDVWPTVDPATGKAHELDFNRISLDPYTGDELSRRRVEARPLWPVTGSNFVDVVLSIHQRLLLPDSVGVWIMGLAGLVWTIDCFVGAYLTWPARLREATIEGGEPSPSARKSWFSRWWNPSWLVKTGGSTHRLTLDLHRAAGLWLWAMLLIMAWSSVSMNLHHQIYMPVMKVFFDMPERVFDLPKLDTPRAHPALGWRAAYPLARKHMEEQARLHRLKLGEEFWFSYDAEKGIYLYDRCSSRDLLNEGCGTILAMDGDTGRLLAFRTMVGQDVGNTLNFWFSALHMALVGGLAYKIFLSVFGLAVTSLSITGVLIWRNKRQARGSRGSRIEPNATHALRPHEEDNS